MAALVVLAACGTLVPSPTDEALGGMGLPTWRTDEVYAGERLPITAEVVVGDDGCAYVDFGRGAMVAIWPPGSTLSSPARLADGTEVRAGSAIEAVATIVPVAALPGGPDGYWSHVTGFCTGDLPAAAVLQEISSVR